MKGGTAMAKKAATKGKGALKGAQGARKASKKK